MSESAQTRATKRPTNRAVGRNARRTAGNPAKARTGARRPTTELPLQIADNLSRKPITTIVTTSVRTFTLTALEMPSRCSHSVEAATRSHDVAAHR
jgi:hypothetical protein